jgi:hypothetical protein
LLAVLTVLVAGVGLLLVPSAAAERSGRPHARTVSTAIVYGRDYGFSLRIPTSFEVFGGHRKSATREEIEAPSGDAPEAPQSSFGFDALTDPFSTPSDTTGALGNSFFVAAVNTQVAVYDRAGTQVVSPIQLEALHPDSVGRFAFDPKVVYDQYSDTFLVVYLVQGDSPRRSLIFAVAIPNATADDTNTWCSTSFPGDATTGGSDVWADYPGVGYNDTRVTITTNQFTFPSSIGQFRSSQVMTIDKAVLYDCNQPTPVPTVFTGTKTRDDVGRQAMTLRPAETVGSSPGPQLMVSFRSQQGPFDYLTLWRIKPTATGFALKKASFPTGKVSLAPLGSQGGGGLNERDLFWDAGDTRFVNAFYDADRNELFTAHTVFKNLKPDPLTGSYPEAAIRWYEIDPAANLNGSIIARKAIIGAAEVDVGWPSVASDSTGTLFVTYNRASDPHDEFLSAWVATILPNSTAATQLLLHGGASTYDVSSGRERWGDYTAINRDPLDGQDLGAFNQYAASSDHWQQFISVVTDN